ncbi:sensor histidine kinase [Thermomicrobium sp. 4228-Ro]|uniref:sensor histidine kinase n=1 Tax=Thermomicrobium sp. 4228-Ro TaxID=2993937 RepID=UPI0022492A1C|nr:sensor histidine kinase [Thermomicrobium sp. 4228-Ro]MCX2727203.1 sensor histidine kinase [Thermomicrobium sp. 4228-Ro]
MRDQIAQILADLVHEAEDAITALEHQLRAIRTRVDALASELEQQRVRLQLHIEERLMDAAGSLGPDDLADLRAAEDRLAGVLVQAQAFSQQLAGFLQLLAVSRQQLSRNQRLPDLDAAKDLLVRQAMVRAQEEERRRLAREIHDGPAQVLANAILTVQYLTRLIERGTVQIETLHQELVRVEETLREGLSETRQFMFALQPTTLQQHGLLRTVTLYLDTLRRNFPAELHVEMPEALPPLTPEQELAAFRVVQEALHNVQRHSHARHCWLRISAHPSEIVIEVADDGQGFRPEPVVPTSSGGFGLQGMRERAELVGGQLDIQSQPSQGTTIRLRIPLAVSAMQQTSLRAGES